MKLSEIGNIFEHLTQGTDIMVSVDLRFIDYTNIHGESTRISSMDIIELITEHINNDKNCHGDLLTRVSTNGNISTRTQFESGTEMSDYQPVESTLLESYLAMYRRLLMPKKG